jgi:hypothetical protein
VGDRVEGSYGMRGPITRFIVWPNLPKGTVGIHVAWEPPHQHHFHWRHAFRGRFRRSTYRCPSLLRIDPTPKDGDS